MVDSYADNIKVKISEKYKPPPKISLPTNYNNRLSLNKELHDNRQEYAFNIEEQVVELMKDWKGLQHNRISKVKELATAARKEFYKTIQEEKIQKIEEQQMQAKLLETSNTLNTTNNLSNVEKTYSLASNSHSNYLCNTDILIPTSVSYNVAVNSEPSMNSKSTDYSGGKPFNISDFEPDTYSPFDNMELKSINDMAELAEVLERDRKNYHQPDIQPTNNSFLSNSPKSSSDQLSKNYNSQFLIDDKKSYNYLPPGSSQNYMQNTLMNHDSNHPDHHQIPSTLYNNSLSMANYNQATNYNPNPSYSNPFNTQNMSYHIPPSISTNFTSNLNRYDYKGPTTSTTNQSHLNRIPTYVSNSILNDRITEKSNCRSVPDVIKALEKELDNYHINDNNYREKSTNLSQTKINDDLYCRRRNYLAIPDRPKSTESVSYPSKKESTIYDRLTEEQQNVCRNISAMGFPLDRVTRVCLVIGNDEKKIVDHLLALSKLLDLGFTEQKASAALIKRNNNTNEAIDLLFS